MIQYVIHGVFHGADPGLKFHGFDIAETALFDHAPGSAVPIKMPADDKVQRTYLGRKGLWCFLFSPLYFSMFPKCFIKYKYYLF